jgi:sporulation protein YlmC with PRC-barrel domain
MKKDKFLNNSNPKICSGNVFIDSRHYQLMALIMDPTTLNGKKVIGSEGFVLGEVEGVDVDPNVWQVSVLYVSLNDEAADGFGLRRRFLSKTTICLSIQYVKSVGDIITLNEPVRNLEDVATAECLVFPTKLKGKNVVGAAGHIVGEVDSLDLDPSNWQVTGLQVSLTKDAALELGFNKSFLSRAVIAIPTKIISSVGNMILLNETITDLKALVEYLETGS